MQLTIDTDTADPMHLRAAAAFLLMVAGDLPDMSVSITEKDPPRVPTGTAPPPPPPASTADVLPFPKPVPVATGPASPAVSVTAPATAAAPAVPPAPAALTVTAVPEAAPEYDKQGFPWDARIHTKSKVKKKDGSWKLAKNLADGVLEAVTQELAAKRQPIAGGAPPAPARDPGAVFGTVPPPPPPGAAAPAAPPVTLPPAGNTVPLPPVPSGAAANGVPVAPPADGASVHAPAAAAGGAGALTFSSLVMRLTAATQAGKLTTEQVQQLLADCGAPNLGQLKNMPQLFETVDATLTAKLAGLM